MEFWRTSIEPPKWLILATAPKSVPFKDIANEWFDIHSEKIETITANSYNIILKQLIKYWGDIDISDIDSLAIQRYLNDLYLKSFAKSTIKKRRDMLAQIFDYAIYKNKLNHNPHNPAKYTTIPAGASTKIINNAKDDDIEIINNSVNLDFGFFAFFLLYTGMRKSEALAVTWDDIDLDSQIISINKKIVYNDNNPTVVHHLKNHDAERTQYILDILYEKLVELKKRKKGLCLFPSVYDSDKYLTKRMFRTQWGNYAEQTNIKITPHQLRHSYATILNKAGVDVKTMQKLLGHKDINVTIKYTHTENEQLINAKNKVDAYLK